VRVVDQAIFSSSTRSEGGGSHAWTKWYNQIPN